MERSLILALAAVAVVAGVGSHLFYFHHGEHFLFPQRYVKFYLAIMIAITYPVMYLNQLHWVDAFAITGSYAVVYFSGIFASLLVYRIFYNPLNKIPGPYMAKVTKFAMSARNLKFDACKQLLKLHERHGQYVRIGPNDLSVTDPEAVQTVLGPQSKCTKAPGYEIDYPHISLVSTRNKAVHDHRRRAWSPAFSTNALRGYEERIEVFNAELIKQIIASSGMGTTKCGRL